jgi:transmembrane sensor
METSAREQAARWVAELDEGKPGVRARFAEWLRESPRHVEELLLLDALWTELGRVDSERKVDVDELVAGIQSGGNCAEVVALRGAEREGPSASAGSSTGVQRWRRAAVVAVLGAGLALGSQWGAQLLTGTQTYATALGEQRAVKLQDGSFVYLNTGSRIKVRLDAHTREIRLLEGEALFQVERDAVRPFRVRAGAATIEALGTLFNVYRRESGTTVSVLEGAVRVVAGEGDSFTPGPSPGGNGEEEAGAGEEIEVVSARRIVKHAADVNQAVAWRQRRLVFRADPLAEVAAQFNRYNSLKIRVEGEAVRARELIGTFDADDPHSLVQFLTAERNLAVERRDGVLVIRAR